MVVAQSKAALDEFLKARGVDIGRSPLSDICRTCLAFYADVTATGIVPLDEDGDMFLFQWGRSKYDKRPGEFHIDMVRQFIVPVPGDDASEEVETEFFQLHCTIWMPAAPFTSIANGHLWLGNPDGAAPFLADLERHPVLVAARGQRQTASEIVLEKV